MRILFSLYTPPPICSVRLGLFLGNTFYIVARLLFGFDSAVFFLVTLLVAKWSRRCVFVVGSESEPFFFNRCFREICNHMCCCGSVALPCSPHRRVRCFPFSLTNPGKFSPPFPALVSRSPTLHCCGLLYFDCLCSLQSSSGSDPAHPRSSNIYSLSPNFSLPGSRRIVFLA